MRINLYNQGHKTWIDYKIGCSNYLTRTIVEAYIQSIVPKKCLRTILFERPKGIENVNPPKWKIGNTRTATELT